MLVLILVLVGKGVIFDLGGLLFKLIDFMKMMKCDMGGVVMVVVVMVVIVKFDFLVNVVGFVGFVENMVSGSFFKFGDVLIVRSGKMIEVFNMDVEGRLVLVDVLNVVLE